MPRNRNRPKPISWNVYKIASKAVWLGEAEAPDEAAAIETAPQDSKYQPQKADDDTAMTRRTAKSPAAISSANDRITSRFSGEKVWASLTVR